MTFWQHPLHPLTVHFPIALYLTGVLFTGLYLWQLRRDYSLFAQWCFQLSWVSQLVSMGVGLIDQSQLSYLDPRRAYLDPHISAAIALFIVTSSLVYSQIRWSDVLSRHRYPYLATLLLGLILLIITGGLGAELVYQWGVGVHSIDF